MGWIKRAWRGEERLWKVFWLYGFLLGWGVFTAGTIIKSYLGMMPYLLFWIPHIAYSIWLMVAEWRCAFNVKHEFWGYVVRVLVVLYLLALPVLLVTGVLAIGVLVHADSVKSAHCEKELKKYIAGGGTDAETFKKQCAAQVPHTDWETTQTSDASPATPPVKPAPPVKSDVVPVDQEKYVQLCTKTMTDYAQKMNADPQKYIAQNQAYLQQCVQYHMQHTAAR